MIVAQGREGKERKVERETREVGLGLLREGLRTEDEEGKMCGKGFFAATHNYPLDERYEKRDAGKRGREEGSRKGGMRCGNWEKTKDGSESRVDCVLMSMCMSLLMT